MSGLAEDNPNKMKNMILAGIFAITAMVGYAFAIGLIQIELTDKEPEQEENPELHKSQPETDKHHENQQTYDQFEPLFEEPGGEEWTIRATTIGVTHMQYECNIACENFYEQCYHIILSIQLLHAALLKNIVFPILQVLIICNVSSEINNIIMLMQILFYNTVPASL